MKEPFDQECTLEGTSEGPFWALPVRSCAVELENDTSLL